MGTLTFYTPSIAEQSHYRYYSAGQMDMAKSSFAPKQEGSGVELDGSVSVVPWI